MTIIVVGFVSLIIYFLTWSYNNTIHQVEHASLMRLGGIVNSLALQIDGDAHQHLTMHYRQKDDIVALGKDSIYDDIHKKLEDNCVANMLHTPIYTIVYDSLSNVYQFGVTSSTQPYYRHLYTSAPKTLMEKHSEGAMIPMYNDEFGTWISAFAVIKNSNGLVVGLVQADEKFDVFIAKARTNIVQNLLVSLFVFIAVLFVLMATLRPLLKQEQLDKEILQSANLKVLQLDTFRKEMIANVSHDLRTPLSNILGYAEILEQKNEQISLSDKQKYLIVIQSEAKKMRLMVSELFDLSKFEAGQITLEKEPMNFSELAQDILYQYQLKAEAKKVRLVTEFQSPLPLIVADVRWMNRVIHNLLDNALKYVEDSGIIKFTIFIESELLHFKICNTGKVVPQEHLESIFDRYFKSTNSTTNSTGLGLAIVKSIIELHEGKVWAESNENITSLRFTIKAT